MRQFGICRGLMVAALVACVGAPSAADAMIVVLVPGVQGDVTVFGFEGGIEASGIQWQIGAAAPKNLAGLCTVGKIVPTPFVVNKTADRASPKLLAAVATQQVFREVTIAFVNTADEPPRAETQYILHDALVTSYSVSSSGDRPSESISFNFSTIDVSSSDGERSDSASWQMCSARF